MTYPSTKKYDVTEMFELPHDNFEGVPEIKDNHFLECIARIVIETDIDTGIKFTLSHIAREMKFLMKRVHILQQQVDGEK